MSLLRRSPSIRSRSPSASDIGQGYRSSCLHQARSSSIGVGNPHPARKRESVVGSRRLAKIIVLCACPEITLRLSHASEGRVCVLGGILFSTLSFVVWNDALQ